MYTVQPDMPLLPISFLPPVATHMSRCWRADVEISVVDGHLVDVVDDVTVEVGARSRLHEPDVQQGTAVEQPWLHLANQQTVAATDRLVLSWVNV